MTLSMGLLLMAILALSCISNSIFKQGNQALAQSYVQTIKHRNLVIDLGNGVKVKAQLTFPAIGKGPFPAVLLIHGSGAQDMNEILAKIAKLFWKIAKYLYKKQYVV